MALGIGEKFGMPPDEVFDRYTPRQMATMIAVGNYVLEQSMRDPEREDPDMPLPPEGVMTDAEFDKYLVH